jgi:prepilin-type N-terminal cleavage/methylation domain-containing protein
MRNRKGLTLTELMIAMVVVAILGTALVQMLVRNSRYVSRVDAMMNARQAARAAMNVVASNLRMITADGLLEASPKRVRVQVPYAWGVACLSVGGTTTLSLLPTDSLTYDHATPDGLAWWDATASKYQTISPITDLGTTDNTLCAGEGITTVPGGSFVSILTLGDWPWPGSVSYLYEDLIYEFKASTQLPGRVGLHVEQNGIPNELLAPFDTSAGFMFLIGPDLTPQANPPGDLTTVRGLELKLVGASEAAPQGGEAPQTFDLRSKVLFVNRGA